VVFKNRASIEHTSPISNTADILSRDIPNKPGTVEHVIHISKDSDIPSRDIPRRLGVIEHLPISVTLRPARFEIRGKMTINRQSSIVSENER
jgi:hypothetical protein